MNSVTIILEFCTLSCYIKGIKKDDIAISYRLIPVISFSSKSFKLIPFSVFQCVFPFALVPKTKAAA
nr:hypothetical protein [Campylobacter hominis]